MLKVAQQARNRVAAGAVLQVDAHPIGPDVHAQPLTDMQVHSIDMRDRTNALVFLEGWPAPKSERCPRGQKLVGEPLEVRHLSAKADHNGLATYGAPSVIVRGS